MTDYEWGRDYGRDARRAHAAQHPESTPVGWFIGKMVRGGPDLPAWIGRSHTEPGNPENMLDTGPILVATIGTREADPLDVVALHERRPITQAEHAFRCAELAWAEDWAADTEPVARPRRRVSVTEIAPRGPR